MDFSVDGSESWESTPMQDNFLQNYFKKKELQKDTATKISRKRKKCPLKPEVTLNFPNNSKKNKYIKTIEGKDVKKVTKNKSKLISQRKELCESETSVVTHNMTDINVNLNHSKNTKGMNSETKGFLKNTTKQVPFENVNEIKNSTKRNLKNKNICNNSTKESLTYTSKISSPIKKSLKEMNLTKRTSNIGEASQIQRKSAVNKIKYVTQSVKNTEKDLNMEDVSDDTDDEVIRCELQNTPMYRKLQKLMKTVPHLDPNFDPSDDHLTKTCDPSNEDWEISSDSLSESDCDGSLAEDNMEDSSLYTNKSSKSSPLNSSKICTHKIRVPGDKITHGVSLTAKTMEDSSSQNDEKSPVLHSDETSEFQKMEVPSSRNQSVPSTVRKSVLTNRDQSTVRNSASSTRDICEVRNIEKSKSLTSFMGKARQKLAAAKFRFLNEKLYTESGGEAFRYFQENKEEFTDYHLGYGLQVSKWPLNPVNEIIAQLQKMRQNIVIADLGCGDAKIAQILTHKVVHSFDLVAINEFVTACDISKVPLANESVDVVVFCLSLMGTNLKDYLSEAHRILKLEGTLKIAEVESRIEDLDLFVAGLKALGFVLERKNTKNKLFVFLDLKKEKKSKAAKAQNITLRPCLYKKR